jgi:hypothetical protein
VKNTDSERRRKAKSVGFILNEPTQKQSQANASMDYSVCFSPEVTAKHDDAMKRGWAIDYW